MSPFFKNWFANRNTSENELPKRKSLGRKSWWAEEGYAYIRPKTRLVLLPPIKWNHFLEKVEWK